jgi:hypothetical protein
MLQNRQGLIKQYVRHSKQSSAQTATAECIKQHKTRHCADTQCCVLGQGKIELSAIRRQIEGKAISKM